MAIIVSWREEKPSFQSCLALCDAFKAMGRLPCGALHGRCTHPVQCTLKAMDLLDRPVLQADHRLAYGEDASQFGDLWLPSASEKQRVPLFIFFHGGWWKSAYDLGYAGYFCRALREAGIAVWSFGIPPAAASPAEAGPVRFRTRPMALTLPRRSPCATPSTSPGIVVAGHSAGGHLAFWIAGRQHLEPGSALYLPRPQLALRGVIALAGAVDLRPHDRLRRGWTVRPRARRGLRAHGWNTCRAP